MQNDTTKLYKTETGKDAIGAWGNDDTENEMYCYVEGPTMDYVRWLEGRASKAKEPQPASTNPGHAAIALLTRAYDNLYSKDDRGDATLREIGMYLNEQQQHSR